MRTLFESLLQIWLRWTLAGGYWGVFLLMAMESSIVAIPSEIVIPPAAYWASQGQLNFWGVIAAGTAGSWFGASVTYWVSRWLGIPFIRRYGRFFFFPVERLESLEGWVTRYAAAGIFASRFLPVIRHLISIPAGVLRTPFLPFSVATLAGSFAWCAILAWFGKRLLGDRPDLLQNPGLLVDALKDKLHLVIPAVLLLVVGYAIANRIKKSRR